jgi:alpha-N-arabinofuranosidase
MIAGLKPGFLRFPGGCYVEGVRLINAFRWRDSIGPYDNRPGHFGDVWNYWTDDGFGYYEGLQLAEDLGAAPIWVFNNGISHQESVATEVIGPWVEDVLDGLEFARGPTNSTWGAVRARMGHPDPFPLHHVAIGNEDCWKPYYRGNYMEFYKAIKLMYPDVQIISNCDGSGGPLNHPADLYDYHIYTNAYNLFSMRHAFDQTSRNGPKAFVSEYAVTGTDSGTGSLLAALAEGAFLIGIELNSDVVHMASYAPLFVNANDRRWNPDAVVFNSWQQYGTPSYWVQHFFRKSNGAHLVPSVVQAASSTNLANLITSAVRTHNSSSGLDSLVVKAVNFGVGALTLDLSILGISSNNVVVDESYITIMTSIALMDENSFMNPKKVTPQVSRLTKAGPNMELFLPPFSIVALELGLALEKEHHVHEAVSLS